MPITKELLSGSAGGRPVLVTDDDSPGTLVHETGTSASVLDEVWLYAFNGHNDEVALTILFGDDDASDEITVGLEDGKGLILIIPGLPLAGTGSGERAVRAFASVEEVVTLSGFVNRIEP